MNNCVIIIFGATGDLAKRKLIPALYQLLVQKKINNFAVVGVAMSHAAVDDIFLQAEPFVPDYDRQVWQQLKERTVYQRLNFTVLQDFVDLKNTVESVEAQYGLSGNRLFYCASAAYFFCDITQNIGLSTLATRTTHSDKAWQRLVYEKPFGHDLHSAHEINECIARWFSEEQIYRIDHYLTKELVSNIALIRFTNIFFEPLWNNNYIDSVQIILSETVGIENRGAYYNAYGALCDVVQNHMLELVSLIAMEAPQQLTGDFIRAQRAMVLEKVEVVDGILGQYSGYTRELAVTELSQTETFAAIALRIDNPRWHGVNFYLKTGKFLNKKDTVIHIKFKAVECRMLRGCPLESNWLTIKIAPDATFSLMINAKNPGSSDELVPVGMELCHSCIFGKQLYQQGYEALVEGVMRGEQSISVRLDEIEYAWRVIDAIKAKHLPLYEYKIGSAGPDELALFEQKFNMKFRV